MTIAEDRPTLPEVYTRAISSTHLEVKTEERGSVDLLIAAGWCTDSLGTSLYRLRAEFDSVRSAVVRAGQADIQARAEARDKAESLLRQVDEAWARGDSAATVPLTAQANKLLAEVEHAGTTERVLVLISLKSLDRARRELGAYASIRATRQRYMESDESVMKIAGRALDAWLDPLCPHCFGTGAVGGFGAPRSICSAAQKGCGGSGRRTVRLWRDNAGHEFGRAMMAEMDRKTQHVADKMRRFLRNR